MRELRFMRLGVSGEAAQNPMACLCVNIGACEQADFTVSEEWAQPLVYEQFVQVLYAGLCSTVKVILSLLNRSFSTASTGLTIEATKYLNLIC